MGQQRMTAAIVWAGVLGLLGATSAMAADIGSIQANATSVKVGQEIKFTVSADGEASTFCGLGIDYGDGETRDIKIDTRKGQTFPVTVAKTFSKPGSYTVKAFGKKVTTRLPCSGEALTSVTVVSAQASSAVSCPAGYALKGKPGKRGDFTCVGGKKASAPEKAMDCGEHLEYFQRGNLLGCRVVR
jgi:hypothetical protein